VGLGAHEPLVNGFVPLCYTACMTLWEEWATVLRPLPGQGWRWGVTPQLYMWYLEIVIILRNIGEDHELHGERHGSEED
jgi:hypothetical protein